MALKDAKNIKKQPNQIEARKSDIPKSRTELEEVGPKACECLIFWFEASVWLLNDD
jgi:hypothetical protein